MGEQNCFQHYFIASSNFLEKIKVTVGDTTPSHSLSVACLYDYVLQTSKLITVIPKSVAISCLRNIRAPRHALVGPAIFVRGSEA